MSISERGVTILVDDIYIYGKDLENVNNIEEFDFSFSTLPIGTCDFNLSIKNEYYKLFTANKAFEVYFNGESYGKYFVVESERVDNDKWRISGDNWIYFLEYENLMESLLFPPGFSNSNAYDIYDAILSHSSVPYQIDETLKDVPAFAYVKPGTIRSKIATMNMAFNTVTTNELDGIGIKKVFHNQEPLDTIQPARIMEGSRIDENSKRVKTLTIPTVLEKIDQSGSGYYDEWPYLQIENGDDRGLVSITEENLGKEFRFWGGSTETKYVKYDGIRYSIEAPESSYTFKNLTSTGGTVIFYQTGTWQIRGKVFNESLISTKSYIFSDSEVLSTSSASVSENEFITSANVEEVGTRLLSVQNTTQRFNCKIAERKHVQEGELYKYGEMKYGTGKYGGRRPSVITYDGKIKLGEGYNIDMQKYGVHTKRVEKMTYNLNGNIIIKDCVLR